MKWRRGQTSEHVQDRRGQRARGAPALAGGGIGAVVIAILFTLLSGGGGGGGGGTGLDDILGQLPVGGPAGGGEDVVGGTGGAADDELEDFMRAVMNDLQATWEDLFALDGQTYEPTSLVLFADVVDTACGRATAAVGPFYCPADRLAYIDFDFFTELGDRFEAPGDFAQAYVIAHEVGHHVQNLLGVTGGGRESNERSIRVELQADCYAGVWANRLESREGELQLSDGDIQEGLDAAAAVGDDRIQEQAGVEVSPETWTHGSAEQRTEWFTTGYRSGDPADCDTFGTGS